MGSIIKKEIRDCAVKNHKTAALLFPLLITSICVVSGVRLDARDDHIKNDSAFTARTIKRVAGESDRTTTEPATVTGARRASEEATATNEPEKEAVAEPQAEVESEDDEISDQPEEEGDKSATDSSPTEAKDNSEKECEEPSIPTHSKTRKRHIIQEEEEEDLEEKPSILVLAGKSKGKAKIATLPASEDKMEQINAELATAATRVSLHLQKPSSYLVSLLPS